MIDKADPGTLPKGRDTRKMAASLMFLHDHSLKRASEVGPWSSTNSFARRYLSPNVTDVNGVAMGQAQVEVCKKKKKKKKRGGQLKRLVNYYQPKLSEFIFAQAPPSILLNRKREYLTLNYRVDESYRNISQNHGIYC